MKYIDADRLIEQLKHYLDIQPATDGLPGKYSYEARGVKQAIDYALSLIKDFQQEQPEVDLEKEYKEYVEDDVVYSKLCNRNVGLSIARHFYELGLKERKEE